MSRTTTTAVKAILEAGLDYNGTTDLQQFIDTAAVVVNRVSTCALAKGTVLGVDELELIERWLAAHLYCQSDKPYSSRSVGGASGAFSGQTNDGFESTLYGQTACRIDYSNCLRNIDKQQRVKVTWLGKPPSAQIPYNQRD